MGKSRSAVSFRRPKFNKSKFQLPQSPPPRPFEIHEAPARAILGACVRTWVRGWVGRHVRPCVRGCTRVGARQEVHKLQFESIEPRGSVGYFLSPAPCSGVGPTFLPHSRVAVRGGCADVLGVSAVSELKLSGSSPATIATKANHMMDTGT